MSDSGIPVVSQIGSAAGSVGHFVGNILSGGSPPVPAAPPAAQNPDTNTDTAAQMDQAQIKEDTESGHGQASNMLAKDLDESEGLNASNTTVSRSVLLGS